MENWILGPTPERSMVGLGQVLTSAILWSIIATASEWDQQRQKSLTGWDEHEENLPSEGSWLFFSGAAEQYLGGNIYIF